MKCIERLSSYSDTEIEEYTSEYTKNKIKKLLESNNRQNMYNKMIRHNHYLRLFLLEYTLTIENNLLLMLETKMNNNEKLKNFFSLEIKLNNGNMKEFKETIINYLESSSIEYSVKKNGKLKTIINDFKKNKIVKTFELLKNIDIFCNMTFNNKIELLTLLEVFGINEYNVLTKVKKIRNIVSHEEYVIEKLQNEAKFWNYKGEYTKYIKNNLIKLFNDLSIENNIFEINNKLEIIYN